jgi:uncharacterized protein YukE
MRRWRDSAVDFDGRLAFFTRGARDADNGGGRAREDTLMTQAIVSPEELRAFAQKLKQFNTMLSDQATMLANQLDTLSATWRDHENKKFSDEFKEHMRLLAQFVEANNRHIPYLLRKAERIDEYLQQR